MNLLEKINQGESKTLELKEQLPANDSIAKTVIAFANTSGGKLVIGVTDQREIIGVLEGDIFDLQDKVASIIFDSCQPAILPEIYIANIDGKLVLVIEVFRGNLLPYYLKHEGKNNGTYIRIGATIRQAGFDNILELERQKRNVSYDEELCYEQDYLTLDITPLARRFAALGKKLDHDKLKNLKLIKDEHGKTYPSHALLLLLGHYEHALMKYARFKGTDMGVFLDRKEYSGDLFSQLEQAEAFIKNHIRLRGEIKGLQRTDTFELPETALREALVNALVHRDYSNHGRDIKVGVYDDLVNIVSPGGFPSTLTSEGLLEGRSEIRNRIIARVFKELGYIEQWGSGIKRIKSACVAQGLSEPRIREKGDFVDVEFYRPLADTSEEVSEGKSGTAETGGSVVETGGLVVETGGSVVETGGSVVETGGLVVETGGSVVETGGSVVDTLAPQIQTIILHLNAHRTITVKTVVELLTIKESRAREILKAMTDKGLLEKIGHARRTHYVRGKV